MSKKFPFKCNLLKPLGARLLHQFAVACTGLITTAEQCKHKKTVGVKDRESHPQDSQQSSLVTEQ